MEGTKIGILLMSKHIVYGNGESRPRKPIVGGDFITWGCNAIYRDFALDNLVSVDYNMQQEIYESGYAIRNKCWFSDWSILPDFDVDVIKMGWSDSEIYETAKLSRSNSSKMEFLTDCVVQGKTRELVESNIKEAMFHNPHLNEKDLRQKMEKDIGLFITWIEKDDQVEEIDFPKGWSAGNTALHLACQSGAEEVYMCGFDGSSYSEPINNIYKGSKNYLPADSRGLNTINWDNQFRMIELEYPNVKFYKVGTELTYEELKNYIR